MFFYRICPFLSGYIWQNTKQSSKKLDNKLVSKGKESGGKGETVALLCSLFFRMSLLTIKRSITSLFLSPADAGVFLFKSCFLTGTMSSCQWQHLQWWCKSWTGYLLRLVTTSWFLLFPEVVQTGQHRSLQESVGRDVQREAVLKASIAYKGLAIQAG